MVSSIMRMTARNISAQSAEQNLSKKVICPNIPLSIKGIGILVIFVAKAFPGSFSREEDRPVTASTPMRRAGANAASPSSRVAGNHDDNRAQGLNAIVNIFVSN